MAENGVLRLDKWLWYARFFKTRTLATKLISGGKLRLDGKVMTKPHRSAAAGMVLTFAQADQTRIVSILALGTNRGSASEAQMLYEDRTPLKTDMTKAKTEPFEMRGSGTGRPTKRERRKITKLKDPFA